MWSCSKRYRGEQRGQATLISSPSTASRWRLLSLFVERQDSAVAVRYLYSAGEIVYPLAVVRELTDGGSGLPVKTMPVKEWVDAAEEKGLDQMLAAYMRSVGESSNPLAFPKLIKGSIDVR